MAKRSTGGVVGKDNEFYFCDKHEDTIIHPYSDCPVCEYVIKDYERQLKVLRSKLDRKAKEAKLLRYELQEERMLHGATKLDVAEYLAQKKLVNALVKDRLK